MKHTKLPWTIEYDHKGRAAAIGSDNILIAALSGRDPKGNAEFIVRACNSHEDLLEACREVQRALTSPSRKLLDSTRQEMEPLLQAVNAAIAKAEGRA